MDIKKLTEELGGIENILQTTQDMKKAKANSVFFSDNYERLLREHPNKWVGVQDEQVVVISSTLDGLLSKMREASIETRTAKVEFLDPDLKPLILNNLTAVRQCRAVFVSTTHRAVSR